MSKNGNNWCTFKKKMGKRNGGKPGSEARRKPGKWEDRWLVAPPLLRRSSSAVTTQRAEDYKKGDSERKNKEKINDER